MSQINWAAFQNLVLNLIEEYRQYRDVKEELRVNGPTSAYLSARDKCAATSLKLDGIRLALSAMFPSSERAQQLNGYILLASEAKFKHADFINNIILEIRYLQEYESR